MLISLLTLFFTKEPLFHCFHAFYYCCTWSLAASAVQAAWFQLAACFGSCLSLIGCSRRREIQNDDSFGNGGKFKRMMLNRDVEVIPWRWREFSGDDDTWRGVPGQIFDWRGRFVDLDRPSMFLESSWANRCLCKLDKPSFNPFQQVFTLLMELVR